MSSDEVRRGLAFGVAAYGLWGVAPLYWRLLRGIDPLEILAHRTVWGLLAYAVLALALGVVPAVRQAARDRRTVGTLLAAGALLAVNWGTFIYAVVSDQVLQSSLGYFLNPLVSVLLGRFVLGERIGSLQGVAIGLAGLGVGWMAISSGGVPLISLVLAVSFALYGLLRKTARVDALAGSTLETLLLAPLGLGYLVWLAATGRGALGHVGLADTGLLALSGLMTALPLVWFTAAARRLPLSTLGFLQYLSPTGQLVLGVLVFHEPLRPGAAFAFAAIWAGLGVFSVALWRTSRGAPSDPRAAPPRL